jgi:hypothetical protein
MNMLPTCAVALIAVSVLPFAPPARSAPAQRPVAISPGQLELHGVAASAARHDGRDAVRVVEASTRSDGGVAVVKELMFENGEIRIDVAGRRGPLAIADDRGFVGIAFRVAGGASHYEYFYLRPDNGRALDQERRNHATQYAAHPDFPWQVLRQAFPSKYESYVDLESGAWTAVRVVVNGPGASLYVNGARQPTLVVNDLRLPQGRGGVALWIGPGTEAFFSNLTISE